MGRRLVRFCTNRLVIFALVRIFMHSGEKVTVLKWNFMKLRQILKTLRIDFQRVSPRKKKRDDHGRKKMEFPLMRIFQVEEMRQRLEEKNRLIEKKTQAVLQAQQERNRMNTELTEIKDHMDIKDRKINVLQRKVGSRQFFVRFVDQKIHQNYENCTNLRSFSFYLFI